MSEVKTVMKRRRRSIGALTMLLGGLMAIGSLFFAVTAASAHHVEFAPGLLCDGSWTANAAYVDGSDERLVILSGVIINGVPLSAGQTNGFSAYDPAVHGVTDPPSSGGLAWRGTSAGFTIFNLSGGTFNANWSGTMTVYRPIGDAWFVGHSTSVYPPSGPTDCAPSTPTPPNTSTPTATATATVVDNSTPTPTSTVPSNTPTATATVPSNTPTATSTVPGNTPTPTRTVPPCTPPGTQTPTGGSTCTPTPTVPASTATPTNTVPPTATRTTPPCTPPDSGQTPTGGSVLCTPTPPPATNTPAGCYNGGGNPPPGAVVCTPTPVDNVAGVRTPGPGVPSAGTGFRGDISNTNMVFALLGLLAVTAGAAFIALGRREEED